MKPSEIPGFVGNLRSGLDGFLGIKYPQQYGISDPRNQLMNLTYNCPHCELPQRAGLAPADDHLACGHCEWSRPLSPADWNDQTPARCLACGCHDLWRQKDF